jgi:hypothetical protein
MIPSSMSRRILLAVAALSLLTAARQRAVRPDTPVQPNVPTFSNEVVRIFQTHCQTCHRDGDIAPFPLTTYDEARPWAQAIKFMTATRKMPPWKPVEGCGDFAEERRLTEDEISTIGKWVDAGAPEGDTRQLPPPRQFTSEWTLGEPDLVLSYPEPYTPPAAGDVYRCFPLRTQADEERFVSAIDVRPGDRGSVHHVIAFIDTTGASDALDAADPAPGYSCFGDPGFPLSLDASTLGGWAPGYRAVAFPEQIGLGLPADSRIVLQVHYHVHGGHAHPDRTELGVYFARVRPQQRLRILPLINDTFEIPAGDPHHRVTATFNNALFSARLWAIAPHMHLLGRSMKVEAFDITGNSTCLINIDDWDFNWQALYRYEQPVPIPAFSTVVLTAYYDNSSANPRNPNNPPKPVRWGEATTDEMCIAFLAVTIDGDFLSGATAP